MNEQKNLQPNEQIQGSKNIWTVILLVILTTLIAGGSVYWWQKTFFQSEQKEFQQQLASLNNQLKLVQQENKNLSEQITELKPKYKETIDEPISQTGWKKFSSGGKSVYSTENWSSYSSTKDNFSFSIEYPGDWVLQGSVFDNSDGNKIAEFSPGLVALQPGQRCFDVAKEDSGRSELISQTDLSIAGCHGVLRVEKVFYKGGHPNWTGYWYPNIFCLMEGEKAFVMSFYEHELGSGDKELIEKILATLKFE